MKAAALRISASGRQRYDPHGPRRVANGRDDTEVFRSIGVDPEIDADWADRRLIAKAEAGRDRRRSVRDRAERLHAANLTASHNAAVDEDCADEIAQRLAEGKRNAILDAALEQGSSAE